MALEYVVETQPLGTGGAIGFAARELEGSFFALNGDSLREADLAALVGFHRSTGAKATILLTPVADPRRYGLVRIAGDGRVESFLEKPRPEEIDTDLINAGFYVLEPEVLDLVPSGRAVSIEREVFPRLAEQGTVYGIALPGYWLDVGTPESYLQAHRDVLERSFPTEVGDALGSDFTFVHPSAEVRSRRAARAARLRRPERGGRGGRASSAASPCSARARGSARAESSRTRSSERARSSAAARSSSARSSATRSRSETAARSATSPSSAPAHRSARGTSSTTASAWRRPEDPAQRDPLLVRAFVSAADRHRFSPRKVEKPWGWELIWAEADEYVGKLLFIRAGEALSLQYHEIKDEAWLVREGVARLELGTRGGGRLETIEIREGRRAPLPARHAPSRHRRRGHADRRGLDAAPRRRRPRRGPLRPRGHVGALSAL